MFRARPESSGRRARSRAQGLRASDTEPRLDDHLTACAAVYPGPLCRTLRCTGRDMSTPSSSWRCWYPRTPHFTHRGRDLLVLRRRSQTLVRLAELTERSWKSGSSMLWPLPWWRWDPVVSCCRYPADVHEPSLRDDLRRGDHHDGQIPLQPSSRRAGLPVCCGALNRLSGAGGSVLFGLWHIATSLAHEQHGFTRLRRIIGLVLRCWRWPDSCSAGHDGLIAPTPAGRDGRGLPPVWHLSGARSDQHGGTGRGRRLVVARRHDRLGQRVPGVVTSM